ncbi:hypothetical protein [Aquibacillus kalidii]|uniref:hypothetical protein n=1 Tax=Aquibacillus kalidii TaxID=2762597 RepID=UPI001644F0CD|nr:hypothetical protein [Aquibacillus kalidii]
MSKSELYLDALSSTLKDAAEDVENIDKDTLKKIIFNGIKSVNSKYKAVDYQGAMHDFQLVNVIKESVERLTPREFMTVFPIRKTYDGEKWGVKDFFSTMETVNEIGMDNIIGDQSSHFLMEYDNLTVRVFLVASLNIMSNIRKFEGKPSIAEEWANKVGINTYKQYMDHTGKEYMVDNNGRSFGIKKVRPSYLKVVK